MSSVATDGKDGYGLKPNFFRFLCYSRKLAQNIMMVSVAW